MRLTGLLQKQMDHTITTSSDETFIFNRDEFMYSIDHVFEEITKQERDMWNSTQGVHIPVEGMCRVIHRPVCCCVGVVSIVLLVWMFL